LWGGSKSAVLSARYPYDLQDVCPTCARGPRRGLLLTLCPRQSWKVRWFQLNPSKKTLSYHEAPGTSALHVIDLHLATEATQIGVGTCLRSPEAQWAFPLAHRRGLRRGHSIGGEGVQEQAALQAGDARTRVVHVRRQRRAASAYYTFIVRCRRHRPNTSIPHSFFHFCWPSLRQLEWLEALQAVIQGMYSSSSVLRPARQTRPDMMG
jgi:hypothetical protein